MIGLIVAECFSRLLEHPHRIRGALLIGIEIGQADHELAIVGLLRHAIFEQLVGFGGFAGFEQRLCAQPHHAWLVRIAHQGLARHGLGAIEPSRREVRLHEIRVDLRIARRQRFRGGVGGDGRVPLRELLLGDAELHEHRGAFELAAFRA